jgi:hypothetical protein
MASFPARLFALLLALLAGSCAAWSGHLLPEIPPGQDAGQPQLPAISYQIGAIGDPALQNPPMPWPSPSLERHFRNGFADARNGPPAGGLHVQLSFQDEMRAPAFTIGLTLVTICTLGIIPAYAREDLTLVARVENDGKLAKVYEYHDRVETWVHLVMIPWAFSNDPVEIQRSTFDNMLRHLLRDLRRDLPQLTAAPAGS